MVSRCPAAKAVALTHLVSEVVLPQLFGGLEASVLFVDLEFTVSVLGLAELLEARLAKEFRDVAGNTGGGSGDANDVQPEKLVRECLGRCHFIRCFDVVQLRATLAFLRELLLKHDCSFLVIDGLAALRSSVRLADLYRETVAAVRGCGSVTFLSRASGTEFSSATDLLRKVVDELAAVQWTVGRVIDAAPASVGRSYFEVSSLRPRSDDKQRRTCRLPELSASR